jgi:acyl-coenzyme A thioesterase PaaI-like protein
MTRVKTPRPPTRAEKATTTEPAHEDLEPAVAGVRRLIAHLRKTQAPPELLARVARETHALADSLEGLDHAGPFAQRRLVLRNEPHERTTTDSAEFFPYSPVVGPLNPIAAPVEFRYRDGELEAEHVFDAPYNGPPTAVHGGVIALVFDELLGCVGVMNDVGGFTGQLEIRYRALTPIGHPIRMRGWIDRSEGRKTWIRGTFHDGETLCAEAEGLFIRPRESMMERALEQAASRKS